MKLSLLLLYEKLADNRITLIMEKVPGPFLYQPRILPPFGRHTLMSDILYIDLLDYAKGYDSADLSRISLVTCQSGRLGLTINNGLVLDNAMNIQVVYEELLNIFQLFQNWDDLVKQKLMEGKPLQEIFDLSSMVTKDTVYLTDASMKMYVHSTPSIMYDISAIWRYQVNYGYMPVHIMNRLITTGELERINSHRSAFSHETETFNIPYTCRNIFVGNTIKARIFVINIYSPSMQLHKEIADELGTLLTPYVSTDPVFSSRAGQVYENLFHDILMHRVQDSTLIQQQISVFGWNLNDSYLVLVIDVSGQTTDSIQFIIDYFSNDGPACKAFEKDEHIICVCHSASITDDRSFTQKVLNLLNKMGTKAAQSKVFTNISNMDLYYRQAASILAFCAKNESDRMLFRQEEFGLYSILDAILKYYNAYELCHPDIISLYELDRENNTEYLETLYQYLLNDRNAVKAAKLLFIHRNTMSYRLEKLKSTLTFDEEDPIARFYALLSIILLKYQIKNSADTDTSE